jgi:hypothetical protein
MSKNMQIGIATLILLGLAIYAIKQQKKINDQKKVEEIKDKELSTSTPDVPKTATPTLVATAPTHVGFLNMVDGAETDLVSKIFD